MEAKGNIYQKRKSDGITIGFLPNFVGLSIGVGSRESGDKSQESGVKNREPDCMPEGRETEHKTDSGPP